MSANDQRPAGRRPGTAGAGAATTSDIQARMAELAACLDVLEYKISNYQRIERSLAAAQHQLPEEESA